jgi:hypothetical protein
MTRKPNRSVAVAGAPAPPPVDPEEAVGVEVEVVLGEIDGDDMVDLGAKCHPVEKGQGCLGPNTRK